MIEIDIQGSYADFKPIALRFTLTEAMNQIKFYENSSKDSFSTLFKSAALCKQAELKDYAKNLCLLSFS